MYIYVKISNKKVCLILLKLMKMLDLYKDSKLLLKLIGFSSLNNLFIISVASLKQMMRYHE